MKKGAFALFQVLGVASLLVPTGTGFQNHKRTKGFVNILGIKYCFDLASFTQSRCILKPCVKSASGNIFLFIDNIIWLQL